MPAWVGGLVDDVDVDRDEADDDDDDDEDSDDDDDIDNVAEVCNVWRTEVVVGDNEEAADPDDIELITIELENLANCCDCSNSLA